jgi:sulfoquinovosyltransferase
MNHRPISWHAGPYPQAQSSLRLFTPTAPQLTRIAPTAAAAATVADANAHQPSPSANSAPEHFNKPRAQRVCIMVEPSPFTYVCGYMNRYRNTIRFLVQSGCEVMVVAPGRGVSIPGADTSAFVDQPEEFEGAKVVSAYSFSCPWYGPLPLSFGLSPRIYKEVK